LASRVLHAAFGADPTTEMAAPERLLRIPLAHGWLPSVSQVVDSYNLASLTTGQERFAPLGTREAVQIARGENTYTGCKGGEVPLV
jgi:DNA/RNA-binding domain of Phe-tRNA-synthetase-like protein